MKDELYMTLLSTLEREGVEVSENGFRKMNGKGKMVPFDAELLFSAHEANVADFMAEWKKRKEQSESSTAAVDESEYEEVVNTGYAITTFVHEDIRKLSNWSIPDTKYFSRFRFAQNEIDGSFILVVETSPGRISAIPMGGNQSVMVSTISSVCSSASPSAGSKYRSLYEELTIGFRSEMQSVVDRWRKKEFRGHVEFVRHMGAHIPHCMLRELTWRMLYRSTTKTVGNESRTFKVPVSMELSDAKGNVIEPIDFIVKNTDSLVARPELKTMMPRIYTNDPSVPALCYIDLDSICKPGPCPTWDKFMERYRKDHADAFMAFIWSIFDADNDGRQMLYIYDRSGFTGKSNVLNCIADVLGQRMCMSLQKDSLNNQFSLAKVWDKRLVTIGDNKNPRLLMSEKMHMMTGHDKAEIEIKNRSSFQATLECRVIASGNIPLEIHPDATHEITRVIIITPNMTEDILKEFCMVDADGKVMYRPDGTPKYKGDRNFKKRLKAEFPQFLTKCREVYGRMCPTGTEIMISDEMYMDILSHAPTDTFTVADFFERNFYVREDAKISVRDFTTVFYDRRDTYIEGCKNPPFDLDSFKEYVMKKYPGVRFGVQARIDGVSVKAVIGIYPKPVERFSNIRLKYELGEDDKEMI